MTSLGNILDELNTDVLLQIFDYLQMDGALIPLSMACWAVRKATIPVLFSHCRIIIKEPLGEDCFVPQALWPYVRSLSLTDDCPDLSAMIPRSRKPKFSSDPLLCGTLCAPFLRDALICMPRLGSIHLQLGAREIHGIGWDSVAAILSVPQLRSFSIKAFLLSPREVPPEAWTDTLAPITTFRYDQPIFRSILRRYPAQQDTLAVILPRLRQSLESLLLPSEVAPIAVLSQTQWPRLRELSLSGEFDSSAGYPTPLAFLFSGMPELRILNLAFALPYGANRKQLVLCPAGYESHLGLPWPDMESLTVSFPDPEDRIFAHLSSSLKRLSLRCTPRHYLHLWEGDKYHYYESPILSASEMLQVLTQLSAPFLDCLQLEYIADDADDDLLRCITERFPRIRTLEIQRFLGSKVDEVPLAVTAQRLAALRSLHTLRAHFERPPYSPVIPEPSSRETKEFDSESEDERWHVARKTANLKKLAALRATAATCYDALQVLQPGIRLWLLHRGDYHTTWRLFRRVSASGEQEGGPQGTQAEFDLACSSEIRVYGLE